MLKLKKLVLLFLFFIPAIAIAQLLYDRDYPAIDYGGSETYDAASLLFKEIEAGRLQL